MIFAISTKIQIDLVDQVLLVSQFVPVSSNSRMLTGKDNVIAEDGPFDHMVRVVRRRRVIDQQNQHTSQKAKNRQMRKGRNVRDVRNREEKECVFPRVIQEVVDPQTGGSRWQRAFCIRKYEVPFPKMGGYGGFRIAKYLSEQLMATGKMQIQKVVDPETGGSRWQRTFRIRNNGLAYPVRREMVVGDGAFRKVKSSEQLMATGRMQRQLLRAPQLRVSKDRQPFRKSLSEGSSQQPISIHKRKRQLLLPRKILVTPHLPIRHTHAVDALDHKESNVLSSIKKYVFNDQKESRQDALDEGVNGELDHLLYSYQGIQLRKPPHRARDNSLACAARKKLPNWSRFDHK